MKLTNPQRLEGTVSREPGRRERLEKFYDRVAPFYGAWGKLFESRASRRACELASLSEGDSVLEVAVGTGEFYVSFLGTRKLRRCFGVDRSRRMLARARRRLARTDSVRRSLCRADACCLPFPEATFDVLFTFYMLDLLPESDIRAAAEEFRRVLKAGGRLVVLNMAAQARVINGLWMWLYHRDPLWVGGCRPVPAAGILAASGWRINVHEQISQGGFRSELIVALVPRTGLS